MTTTTDDGLDWYWDRALGRLTDEIDTIAVGTGSGAEGAGASSLTNEVYRATKSDSNVEFLDVGIGEGEAVITLKGGTEVTGGTEITEMAVIAGGGTGGTILHIDEFAGVVVEAGHTEEFTMPFRQSR